MRDQVKILNVNVDCVNLDEAMQKVEEFVLEQKPHHIVTANPEIIYASNYNPELLGIVNHAALVTADGTGVVWASGQLGRHLQERVTGIDLVYKICEKAPQKGWKLFILGSAPGVADAAADNIRKMYPGVEIVGTQHGYFKPEEEPEIVEMIKKSTPDVLFVALGAPKQEFWISKHMDELQVPVMLGIGGSMDVLSGNVKRAPEIWQKMNLEWLYRLLSQPSRWKRMLNLPKFAVEVLKQKRRKK